MLDIDSSKSISYINRWKLQIIFKNVDKMDFRLFPCGQLRLFVLPNFFLLINLLFTISLICWPYYNLSSIVSIRNTLHNLRQNIRPISLYFNVHCTWMYKIPFILLRNNIDVPIRILVNFWKKVGKRILITVSDAFET